MEPVENNLIEESATVVERDGDYVFVESVSRSACGSCGSSGHCGTGMLAGLLKPRRNRLRLFDHLELKVGEQVRLGMPSGDLAKAAAVVYLLPLLAMVVVAMIGSGFGFGDGAVLLLSLGGLIGAFALLRLAGRFWQSGLVRVQLLGRVSPVTEQFIQFVKQ